MDKAGIYQRLQNIENELARLGNTIFSLKGMDITKHPENCQKLGMDAALRSERITCQLRSLIFASGIAEKSDYMMGARDAHGICIDAREGILSIRIPSLLPKRKSRTNTAFLNEPLHYALQEYFGRHVLKPYSNCVVCFSQVYDRSLTASRIRDYDNLEFKQVLDTISVFVLRDDSGMLCDMYHTTERGEESCTLIHIMGKDAFPGWLEGRIMHGEPISRNCGI